MKKIKPLGLYFCGTSHLCVFFWKGGHIHFNTHTVSSLFSPRIPNVGYSFETNSGKPFHYFTYGVACSEVEIDCLTGDHKVRCLQNFSTKGGKEEKQLNYNTNQRQTLVGKIMPYIMAWDTSFKGPESKNFRLLGPEDTASMLSLQHETAKTYGNKRAWRWPLKHYWHTLSVDFTQCSHHHILFLFLSVI